MSAVEKCQESSSIVISKKRKLSNETEDETNKKLILSINDEQISIETLLAKKSAKEKQIDEILEMLEKPTAKQMLLREKFKSNGKKAIVKYCDYVTRKECEGTNFFCDKYHFTKIIHKHTDVSLGDCSFLNRCFNMERCKYVHYVLDDSCVNKNIEKFENKSPISNFNVLCEANKAITTYPPQWIQCDVRIFDMSILGKFSIIMADPPWNIHMDLPYGTMKDDEMKNLKIAGLQDDGYIFLWVTGRAMELGRECLALWGYKVVDEIIWVKTNQRQNVIRSGRTGHWLNHAKEHCIVGQKGSLKINRGLDADVIVAEVRDTSRKPDEIYDILERMSPGTRKLEIFGRSHNVMPNWITLGNQLEGVKLIDPELITGFKKLYPMCVNL